MKSKKNIALLIGFCVFVLAICSCFFGITYTLMGDAKSGSTGNIEIATLDFEVTSSMTFPATILPNTTYQGDSYSNSITNTGNSREIFIRVRVDSSIDGYMEPIYDTTKWAKGGQNNNEYYYLGALAEDETVVFNSGFRTLNNFTNDIAGNLFNVRLTVYALQAQYHAFEDTTNGWYSDYTPTEFINYYETVKDTYK